MNTDFRDASKRHLNDAVLLETNQRWANADQLYGISAECSLKAIMLGLGHTPDNKGAPEGHADHINVLLGKFQTWANGLFEARHISMLPATSAFSQWAVHQRYWNTSNPRFVSATVSASRQAAEDCRDVLNALILDGVV